VANNTVRILGIDPGLRITGFGVIEKTGPRLVYVASGCVKAPQAGTLPERLAVILASLGEVIETHCPGEVALEKVFVNVNPESTLLLGQARRGNLRGRSGEVARRGIHGAADQAGRGRNGTRPQRAGSGDGEAAAAVARTSQS